MLHDPNILMTHLLRWMKNKVRKEISNTISSKRSGDGFGAFERKSHDYNILCSVLLKRKMNRYDVLDLWSSVTRSLFHDTSGEVFGAIANSETFGNTRTREKTRWRVRVASCNRDYYFVHYLFFII